jgi:hypothetical protein
VYLGNIYEQLLGKWNDGAKAYYFNLLDTYAQQLALFTANTGRCVKLATLSPSAADFYHCAMLARAGVVHVGKHEVYHWRTLSV